MILSDTRILQAIEDKRIVIDPFTPAHINPNSYDLTLGAELKTYPRSYATVKRLSDVPQWARKDAEALINGYRYELPLDPKEPQNTLSITMTSEGYVLHPGEVYLYSCIERIGVKGNICAQVMAKSSLGRLGLDIVIGPAGWIDSGFEGSLVLELRATRPIRVYPNMKIAQIKYSVVDGFIAEDYSKKTGSKYMNQEGVQESLMHRNFK